MKRNRKDGERLLITDVCRKGRKPLRVSAKPGISPLAIDDPLYVVRGNMTFEEVQQTLSSGKLCITALVLGRFADAFTAFDKSYQDAARVLDLASKINLQRIMIRTRSPLLVLALPSLRNIQHKLEVTVCFEALDDDTNAIFTPWLPAPSERIKLLRALKSFGFSVKVQVAPLMQKRRAEESAAAWFSEVREITGAIEAEGIDQLMTANLSDRLSQLPEVAHHLDAVDALLKQIQAGESAHRSAAA